MNDDINRRQFIGMMGAGVTVDRARNYGSTIW